MGQDEEIVKKRKAWVPFAVRAAISPIPAILLIHKFLSPQEPSYFPFYMGTYFLANGLLTFKVAKAESTKTRGAVLAALVSIIGGLMLMALLPFYKLGLLPTDVYVPVISPIVILIGLLQLRGAVHITPQPVVKQAHIAFGFMEVLLGVVLIIFPNDWMGDAILFIWLILVSIYMAYVAHHLRNIVGTDIG